MKKIVSLILCALLALSTVSAFAADLTIAVPNDPTNEGRALLLLQAHGIIKLSDTADVKATVHDIVENPLNIQFVELEAPMVYNSLADVDYAIINNNFALDAGMNPAEDSLLMENADSPYANVLCVKEGNENTDAAKALAAALNSQKVADFINTTYNGAAVSVVAEPTDGFDPTVDYEALAAASAKEPISIACSPAPHLQILELAAEILAEKNVKLNLVDFADYVQPNMVVEAGDIFANYFAHIPYQDDFNKENGTHIVSVAAIHVEPMCLYGGKQSDLNALTVK